MSALEAQFHAERVLQRVRASAAAASDDIVAQSWQRCVNEHRLHPERMRSPRVVSRENLDQRRAQLADVMGCARHEMTTLYQQLADADSAVVLTDTDGVILHMVASPAFAASASQLGFRPGAIWNEAELGTNGPGTCLAAQQPVSVRRDEHFFTELTELTCSAVPVYDPTGRITAVLDVTSRSPMQQQHVLVLLGMTAKMIENRLLDVRFRHAHPLHFHTRPEFIYTLHEGKLALDDDGRILAANRSALFQLGVAATDELVGRRIETVFQSSLADLVQRSQHASFHPVVTYRANASLRLFVVARRPAVDAERPPGAITPPSPVPFDVRPAPRAPLASPRAATPLATPAVDAPAVAEPPALPGVSGGEPLFLDPRLQANLAVARRVVARHAPILLCGETGSGKECFAKAVHAASPLAAGPFVAVNCASLPESLIESELFGYRAGAFTGAQRTGRRGKILQADGGTLFLDEIADMPLELQARLLRVLDERQVTPLGTEDVLPVTFQLISASHQHLPSRVRDGRFREDLYYRLAGVELDLPPLRARADRHDVVLSLLAAESGGQARLSPQAEQLLMAHPWPGNVRQLRHVLRTAVALCDDGLVTPAHLPSLAPSAHAVAAAAAMLPPMPAAAALAAHGPAAVPADAPPVRQGVAPVAHAAEPADGAAPSRASTAEAAVVPRADTAPPAAGGAADDAAARLNPIQANERKVLLQYLEQQRWNVSGVAKSLGISRSTLYRKLHRLHIPVTQDAGTPG